MSNEIPSYDEFEKEWLQEIEEGNPSSTEKGRRFAHKLIVQRLNISEDSDDFYYSDGSGDGGIDIAYLQRDFDDDDSDNSGNTWYLIQSKYNTAFSGEDTLIKEINKITTTLEGKSKLSNFAQNLNEKLQEFVKSASENDKIILLFATNKPLSEQENETLKKMENYIKSNFSNIQFRLESVSIKTIYDRLQETVPEKPRLIMQADLSESNNMLIGSIKLLDIYKFLQEYKKQTNDLDLIYDKNVRKFLGTNKKVNKGIKETLEKKPEVFGLYNNGITIVVEDFHKIETKKWTLAEPYIVNGCQTTKTIWEVLDSRLNNGATGKKQITIKDWEEKLDKGIVIVKIVKIGDKEDGNNLLVDTTRYTNSQNAVGAKDFIALEKSFQDWHKEFLNKYEIYLEIQRGGWDSYRALEKRKPNMKKISDNITAFELLKVYAAGWLRCPGTAFGLNPPFAPGGTIFKKVTVEDNDFGVTDLYAAYLLSLVANKKESKEKFKKAKFVFYYIFIELLKPNIFNEDGKIDSKKMINLLRNESASKKLEVQALQVIEKYLDPKEDDCIFKEPSFANTNDLNAFLKTNKFCEKEETPRLYNAIAVQKAAMKTLNFNKEIVEILG